MIWLRILGILFFLLFLLCMTRVGACTVIQGGEIKLDVKIGLFRLCILPKKPKKPNPQKEAKAEAKKSEAEAKKLAKKEAKRAEKEALKEARKGEAFSVKTERVRDLLADAESAVNALWPPLKRALNRTRKGIRIDPLELSLTVGAAEDPAAGAQLYGYLHAGVWTVMPMLEQVLDIPNPYIHVGLDFESPDTAVEGTGGITIRIGTLLAVGITVAIPALRWFLQWRKKNQQRKNVNTVETKKG